MLIGVTVVTVAFNLIREQTWLPLAAMVGAGSIGLIDDIINLRSNGKGVAGLRAKKKLLLIGSVALVGGLWFYLKNGIDSFHVPWAGAVVVGWVIVPLFVFVVIATANAVNISDGWVKIFEAGAKWQQERSCSMEENKKLRNDRNELKEVLEGLLDDFKYFLGNSDSEPERAGFIIEAENLLEKYKFENF
jgi:hypothetical protein